ncbi:hypothetical protein C1T31_12175 [Hanstruepera neustonica]|uniref:Protein SirB1 N-terminal domain-containing protein n=1 Tax=Hanstruepera neustonica TaxID=1445657 RepID=A0A2K1DWB2_9FLAO|nr:hypothetical protein [Hanstruepera neustonica]PNQ72303.1 hypothetical protein C1T31_12175 [Hanstruepera neustonica]
MKFIASILLLFPLVVLSQSYHSEYEEAVFENLDQVVSNTDFFKSLLAIDSVMTTDTYLKYKSRVDDIIIGLPEKESKEKKEKKRIHEIYDLVHETFFKKYEIDSYFNDIFETGEYNCVTATALYAYIFSELNVPYHVKEAPSHVFLIVYPDTFGIYLETTIPGTLGFQSPSDSEIKKMVDELVAYKLVTDDEVSRLGYKEIYNTYLYGKEFVPSSSLIGMQYYNKGVLKNEVSDYKSSINNFKKAGKFYDSPIVSIFLKTVMFSRINELEFNSKEDVEFLCDLINVSEFNNDYNKDNLYGTFSKIINHYDNDSDFIDFVINKFDQLENQEVRQIALEYFLEYLARENANKGIFDKALQYSDSLLEISPKNRIAMEVIEFICFKKVSLSTLDINSFSEFQGMVEKYPFIKDNNRYEISLSYFYSRLSYLNFSEKNPKEGQEYMKKLEDLLENKIVFENFDKGLLSTLYIKAGNYYYYKEYYNDAYKIYKKGLEYIPDHYELKKRLNWCFDEIKN